MSNDKESPWSQPPFWATTHNDHELSRRAHRRLRLLRKRLWNTDPRSQLWQQLFNAIQRTEIALGLTPTTLKREEHD